MFHDTHRRDEIGDLARALQELTRRLDEHIHDVERFASDVAHEFKNPLASIRTAAEMAAQAEDPRDRARFLGLLSKDVDRLDRLVSDVRDLARIDTQLEQEPLHPVDVGAVVSQVIDGLRFAHGPEPAMSVRVAAGPLRVAGSADRLAQAFENILSNARSFAPAGTAVDVDVRPEDGFCRVSIADRGPGIPPAHLDRVFERFFTYRPMNPAAEAATPVSAWRLRRRSFRDMEGRLPRRIRPKAGRVSISGCRCFQRPAGVRSAGLLTCPCARKAGLNGLRYG